MICPLNYWQLSQPTVFRISQKFHKNCYTISDWTIHIGMLNPWLLYMYAHLASIIRYQMIYLYADCWTYTYILTCADSACVYVCVRMCTRGKCVHTDRHTGRVIVVHCIYHNHVYTVLRFSLVVWIFVCTMFMSILYCLLLLSSFNFWLDGLSKNCIYDNVWLSFTRDYITVILSMPFYAQRY